MVRHIAWYGGATWITSIGDNGTIQIERITNPDDDFQYSTFSFNITTLINNPNYWHNSEETGYFDVNLNSIGKLMQEAINSVTYGRKLNR